MPELPDPEIAPQFAVHWQFVRFDGFVHFEASEKTIIKPL